MSVIIKTSMILVVVMLIAGCATPGPYVVDLNDMKVEKGATYGFKPLKNTVAPEKYPNAGYYLGVYLRSEFKKHGFPIVTDGKEDVSIRGTVAKFYKGSFNGGYSSVGLILNAVDRKTNKPLWTASYTKTTKFHFDYEPSALAREVVEELVKKLMDSKMLR